MEELGKNLGELEVIVQQKNGNLRVVEDGELPPPLFLLSFCFSLYFFENCFMVCMVMGLVACRSLDGEEEEVTYCFPLYGAVVRGLARGRGGEVRCRDFRLLIHGWGCSFTGESHR